MEIVIIKYGARVLFLSGKCLTGSRKTSLANCFWSGECIDLQLLYSDDNCHNYWMGVVIKYFVRLLCHNCANDGIGPKTKWRFLIFGGLSAVRCKSDLSKFKLKSKSNSSIGFAVENTDATICLTLWVCQLI